MELDKVRWFLAHGGGGADEDCFLLQCVRVEATEKPPARTPKPTKFMFMTFPRPQTLRALQRRPEAHTSDAALM